MWVRAFLSACFAAVTVKAADSVFALSAHEKHLRKSVLFDTPLVQLVFEITRAVVAFDKHVEHDLHAALHARCTPDFHDPQWSSRAPAQVDSLSRMLNTTIDNLVVDFQRAHTDKLLHAATLFGSSLDSQVRRLQAQLAMIFRPWKAAAAHASADCAMLRVAVQGSLAGLLRQAHIELQRLHFVAYDALMVPRQPPHAAAVSMHRELGLHHHGIVAKLLSRLGTEGPGSSARPLRMVEIGVLDASFAESLLEALPNLHWLGVDPFVPGAAYSDERKLQQYAQAISRVSRFQTRASILRMFSSEAANWIQDSSVDIIWIDGDHSYAQVLADMRAYTPKLRPGGILAGHDYSFLHDGVIRAVHEFFAVCPAGDGILHLAPDHTFFWRPDHMMPWPGNRNRMPLRRFACGEPVHP